VKLLAVSLDLDEVHQHLAVHGLDASPGEAPAFRLGLPRALAWAREARVTLTLFAVAGDARDPFIAASLRGAWTAGHPVESHSATHPYDLVRLDDDAQQSEIAGSVDTLAQVTGRRPVGFRAPGYLIDDRVLDRVEEAGLAFDASVLPSPAYVAAKAAVIAGMALRGRRSVSLPRGARMAIAPREPYRPGRPFFRRGARDLVELPVAVTPGLRLPAIGTSIGALPERLARLLARRFAGDAFVGLELHAMDFLAADDPGLQRLVGHQPELRRTVAARSASLGAFVEELLGLGFAAVTLEEAARSFRATLPRAR
jgi:hypothetical protein